MVSQSTIDWSSIRNLEDVKNLGKHLIYDTSSKRSNIIVPRSDLTPEEKDIASFWKDFIQGFLLITGEPGSGKGIFMHLVAYQMRYLFNKLIVTDTHPREAFGDCIPFSFPMLVEQLDRINEVDTGMPRPYIVKGLVRSDFGDNEQWEEYRNLPTDEKLLSLKKEMIPPDSRLKEYNSEKNEWVFIPNFIPHIDSNGKWLSSRGEVFLQDSVMLLDEAGSKYIPRSKPNLSSAVLILNLLNFWRHLNCLIVGVSVSLDDFNLKALDKAMWEAKCVKMDNVSYRYSDNPNDIIIKVYLDQVKFNQLTNTVQRSLGKTQILTINASEPKKMLNGKSWVDLYNTENAQGMLIPQSLRRGL